MPAIKKITAFIVFLISSTVLIMPVSSEVNKEATFQPVVPLLAKGVPAYRFTPPGESLRLPTYFIFLPLVQKEAAYYVALTGNDANPGTFNAPWRTLQKAADAAPAGVVVYVREGNYFGFKLIRSNLTFASYPGETPIVIWDTSRASNTIKIQGASDIVIQGLIVQDNSQQYGAGINIENASNIVVANNILRNNQGFGLVLKDVTNVVVEGNDVTKNANGIEIRYGSAGVILRNNRIYQNDQWVDSGRGGIGVNFYKTTGPITAEANLLWENHTLGSIDNDGVAFEIYGAANITMTGNIMWDNEAVLETGTESGIPCRDITFTRNIAYQVTRQQGLILRCASYSLFAHNTFDGLTDFVFDLSHYHGQYGASIGGLRILNNLAVNGRVYSIDNDISVATPMVVIDYNLSYNPGQNVAYVYGQGNTQDLAIFQSWTGYEAHGLSANPLFVNSSSHDYHLTAGSPAIDKGAHVLTDPFNGVAPDLGRYEYP